jgi:Tol biopolymer transport system component
MPVLPAGTRFAKFSPDGRWVTFISEESQRGEVYVSPFSRPGGKWQISTNGGIKPRWRRDGKEIFYLSPEGQVDGDGGPPKYQYVHFMRNDSKKETGWCILSLPESPKWKSWMRTSALKSLKGRVGQTGSMNVGLIETMAQGELL